MPGRSPMGWPGRRGSLLKPFARGSEEGSNSASARGPEKAVRRSGPGDAAARRVGESLCASSVVRKAAEPAKTRPPAARKRRPGGASPVTLWPGRRGSRCAPRQWSGRRQSPQKIVRPRPGRSACPEATAGPNPFRGRPSGLTRWRCGSAGGGVITCPSVARQGSSKGRPGGEMQSGTSARHYLFARGPAKAARQRQPGEGGPEGFTRWRCGPRVEE